MPQDRLFNPGPKSPNAWSLHPDKWLEQPGIVYHATDSPHLPRVDRGPNHTLEYGGSEGMHFGTKVAAYERATSSIGYDKTYIHAARLNTTQFSQTPLTDDAANYGNAADKAVHHGQAVPYKNTYEGAGSVSYRVRPESTRTWDEDVRADPNAHPALKHLAERGYNPVLKKNELIDHKSAYHEAITGTKAAPQLFGGDVIQGGKAIAHHTTIDDAKADYQQRGGHTKGVGWKDNNGRGASFEEQRVVAAAVPRLRPTLGMQ